MVTASLSRSGTAVTFELWEESSNLLIGRDIGKPEGGAKTVSRIDPRSHDNLSALDRFTVVGRLEGSTAYADALVLAEELVKQHPGDTGLTLDLSNVTGYSSYTVGAPNARALELDYRPGIRDVVDMMLSVPNVSSVLGGSSTSTSTATTSGSGPLKLSGNGNSITLSSGLGVQRRVGRPEAEIRSQTGTLPNLIDKNRSASDIWEITAEFTSGTARSDATSLIEDIIRPRLGRGSLTLDFQGLWGLGSYSVFPEGSQSARVSVQAGEGTNRAPVNTLGLRVVDNS